MPSEDAQLIQWARQAFRSGVTLGQLTALLELTGSTSVAAMSGSKTSHAVNYRQKLDRLERALGLGRLTTRVGGATRVNESGRRVAGEIRMMIQELRAVEQSHVSGSQWVIGAGDAWLQSLIAPALADLASADPQTRWEIRNLRMIDIARGLRDGRLHFGFARSADLSAEDGLTAVRSFRAHTFSILVGHAQTAPTAAATLAAWVLQQRRPLVQQGTSWPPLRARIQRLAGMSTLASLEPAVICETHTQAAAAAIQSASWCLVPTPIARLFARDDSRLVELNCASLQDEMVLVTYARHTDKLPRFGAATKALKASLHSALCPNRRP